MGTSALWFEPTSHPLTQPIQLRLPRRAFASGGIEQAEESQSLGDAKTPQPTGDERSQSRKWVASNRTISALGMFDDVFAVPMAGARTSASAAPFGLAVGLALVADLEM